MKSNEIIQCLSFQSYVSIPYSHLELFEYIPLKKEIVSFFSTDFDP